MSRSEQVVAAIIGAIIVGILGIIGTVIASSSGASHAPPGTTNSSSVPLTPPASPSSDASPSYSSATPAAIRHEGEVVLAGSPIQLDSTAANWNAGNPYHDLEGGGYSTQLSFDNVAFKLQPSDPSSYSTCANATGYTPNFFLNTDQIEVGDRFCTITNGGRYSLIRVDQISPSVVSFTLHVITWEPQKAS